MKNLKIFIFSILILLFSGCGVSSLNQTFSFTPPKGNNFGLTNRIAVITNLDISLSMLDNKSNEIIKHSLITTLESAGMYKKVYYGFENVNSKDMIVDTYDFSVSPRYTQDFDWLVSWPAIFPMPLYWPLQKYQSKITSKIKFIAIINKVKYEKEFISNTEVNVNMYGFFKTQGIKDSFDLVIKENLENTKSYIQSTLSVVMQGETLDKNNRFDNKYAENKYKKVNSIYNFKGTSLIQNDSFALVIGINKYKQNTPVEYADLSALAFAELANKTLGIPKENIITLLNDAATSGQLKAKIELIKELSDKYGNLYVYFAGHGVPGKDGSTYLLPNDMSADSIHLEPNLKLDSIYSKLSKAEAKNVFVFMDSCFSGKDDKGSLLYKGVAPVLKTKKTVISSNKLTIFTAGKSTDFANDYEDKKQRLFSYYLIKELASGETDLSKVYGTIKNKVKRSSLRKGIGYKQVPQLYGNKDKLLF